jgi:spermidine/putrescine transport system permease protein
MADLTAPTPFVASRRQRRMLDLTNQPGFRGIAYFCLFMLYAPIAVLVVYSFNANRSVTIWTGFSIDWFIKVVSNDQIKNAALTSIQIAVVATIGATIAATAAALATTRTLPYRGLSTVYVIINLPLMVPEIVTAVATLSFFAMGRTLLGIDLGLLNLMLAHMVFCIPFAYLPIRARLEDMDRTLEQAAADLYASPWHAFRHVTLPLLTPGIIAGAMLAFITSIDDVTITTLVAGPGQTTLPIYIFGQIRRGITPETNAVSTIMLAVSVLLVSLFFFLAQRRKK